MFSADFRVFILITNAQIDSFIKGKNYTVGLDYLRKYVNVLELIKIVPNRKSLALDGNASEYIIYVVFLEKINLDDDLSDW